MESSCPFVTTEGGVEEMKRGSDLSWCDGWPLAIAGALVLHLGALDESLVRAHDTYLCIRPEPETSKPELYAVWRGASAPSAAAATSTPSATTPPSTASLHHPPSIVYRRLDPIRDPVTPLAVEMLTEDLPALLQNLLVGIERAISRVPLEDLSFPTPDGGSTPNHSGTVTDPPSHSPTAADGDENDGTGGTPGTPKLGLLKRRELITRNKKLIITSKYTQLKRQPLATVVSGANLSTAAGGRPVPAATGGGNQNGGGGGGQHAIGGKSENAPQIANPANGSNQRNDGLSVTICDTGGDEGGGQGGQDGGGDNQQSTAGGDVGSAAAAAGMPLFCLGGSFPHIDSDEESSDEQKKCETAAPQHLPHHEIVAPRSIRELPEKLLTSGISIPAAKGRNGRDPCLRARRSRGKAIVLRLRFRPTSIDPMTISAWH
uniref:Uncharacterized protein n=1 Tax=Anopheles farauti TaxID=69004 RepID=A0A182Q636_9DIPT